MGIPFLPANEHNQPATFRARQASPSRLHQRPRFGPLGCRGPDLGPVDAAGGNASPQQTMVRRAARLGRAWASLHGNGKPRVALGSVVGLAPPISGSNKAEGSLAAYMQLGSGVSPAKGWSMGICGPRDMVVALTSIASRYSSGRRSVRAGLRCGQTQQPSWGASPG